MFIKELTCKNFRNYKNLFLEFSSGINLITGLNATGKSNILESISILSNIRSFRNVPDSEIIKWGENSYFCSLTLDNPPFMKFEIGCASLSNKIKKKAKIDGIAKKRVSDYYGKFLTVIFSPDDIALVTGPPEIRRRFFDAIISKVDIDYLNILSEFKRIIASRNIVLRDIREKKKNKYHDLDVWDNMLAQRASVILKKRIEFLNKFNSWFRESNLNISKNIDSFYIEYNSTNRFFEKDNILEDLLKARNKDIFNGSTGVGPHRDDYLFLYGEGRIFKNCASQGQKRTASISLKIAEYKFIEQETKNKPVILMDDVLEELDDNRRKRIMDLIDISCQVIITAVYDLIQKDNYLDLQRFQVLNGGVVKKL